jgi:PAS domain S-box-containing protein
MQWQEDPYTTPLLVAATITLGLAVFAWRRRSAPGATAFVVLMLGVALWSLTYALRLASGDLDAKLIWAKARYLGIVVVPAAWLVFALQQTGRGGWLTVRRTALLAFEPLAILLLVWTNDWHGWYWSDTWLNDQGAFVTFGSAHGWAFWIHAAWSYLLLLGGACLLVRSVSRSSRLYRLQAAIMLAAALAPLAANVMSTFGLSPFPHLDLTPFAFTLTGLAMAWGLYRFRLLDIVPVARDAVLESMGDGVIVLDARMRLVDLNPAACILLGQANPDVIGRPAHEVLASWPGLIERCHDATEIRDEIVVEEGTEWRAFDLRVSRLRDRRGRLSGELIVLRDVTDRKQMEKELQEAMEAAEAASQAKSEFLSFVSHELRVPISSIMGSAGLLTAGIAGRVTESQAKYLSIIENAAKHMTTLVSDLTDISLIESGRLRLKHERVSPLSVVEEVVASTQSQIEGKDQTLTLAVPRDLPKVWGDRTRLVQILHNLVSNANKYTPAGGKIIIRAESTVDRRDPRRAAEAVRVTVEDNGIGIHPDDEKRVFDEFFRVNDTAASNASGTGLGLSIARSLVEMLDGHIWFESEYRAGTSFHFVIPVAPSHAPKESRRQVPGFQRGREH